MARALRARQRAARKVATAMHRPPAGPIVLTYDDYRRFPHDGRRYELWEGVLQVTPAPSPRHQDAVRNLLRILDDHVRGQGLGKVYAAPIDVVLSYITVVQPDLLYLSRRRLHLVTAHNIAGPPDLVVEVLCPTTAQADRNEKAQLYARHGVPHLWLVDPDARTLEAYELEGTTYRLVARLEGAAEFLTALFPGLRIDLGQVWE